MDHKDKSLVEKLYDGQIFVSETFDPHKHGNYVKALQGFDKELEEFRDSLPEEYRQGFERVIDVFTEAAVMEYADLFALGFSMGMQLMSEVQHPQNTTRSKRVEEPEE